MISSKTNKPLVRLEADKGNLRLAWQYQGRSHTLYLGLKDTKPNRLKAKDTILLIEADIEQGTLDTTKTKYKPHKATGKSIRDLTCSEIYQDWLVYKGTHTDKRNVESLRGNLSYIDKHLKNKIARTITKKDTQAFFIELKNTDLKPDTIKRKLENLTACWAWAIENNYLDPDNPWKGLSEKIKVTTKHEIKPFTTDEIDKILNGLGSHPKYFQLQPFVRFLFGTGCRTGEAIGLRWSDLSKDYKEATISEQLTSGVRKSTKTGKIRTLYLPASIIDMLVALKEIYKPDKPDALIFQWNNSPINLNNFRRRVWQPLLEDLNIPYRTVYNTRSTFISHALEKGINPVTIAQMTGHDVSVLFMHYAGSIHKIPQVPELF